MFGAKVPSISPNSPNLGEFRMFFEYDRTYSDYMKPSEFGNMKHFTRTFANLSEASNERILKEMTPITSGLRITCASLSFGKFSAEYYDLP